MGEGWGRSSGGLRGPKATFLSGASVQGLLAITARADVAYNNGFAGFMGYGWTHNGRHVSKAGRVDFARAYVGKS